MRTRSLCPSGISLLALAVCTPAVAAEAPRIEQVVVTANRVEQSVDKVLAPVTVFEREDIERLQIDTVDELFRHVAGLQYRVDGGPGGASSIYMRGTSSKHALVLIDGIRMESATSGQAALEYLHPNDIERVEIVRGPRAALYGSDALGGVIQIFTRKGGGQSGGEFKTAYGSHKTRINSAAAGIADERSRLHLTAGQYERDGFSRVDSLDPVLNDDDAYRNTTGALHASHQFESSASVRANYRRGEGKSEFDGSDWSSWPPTPTKPYTDVAQESGNLSLSLPLAERWSSELNYGYLKDEQVNQHMYVDEAQRERYITHRRMGTWQNTLELSEQATLLGGLEYIRDEIDTEERYNQQDIDKKAAFAQYQGEQDAFSWVLGGRHDDSEQFGEKDTWSAEGGYEFLHELRLVASVGTAFRAPSMNDLYYPRDSWDMMGNPQLKPEQSLSKELAIRGKALGLDQLAASVFHSSVEDLISWEYDSVTGITQPENVDSARIVGLELEGLKQLEDWRISANATWLQPEDRDTGKRLPLRTKRFGNIDVDRSFGRLSVGASVYAQGDVETSRGRELGGYATVALRTSYAVMDDLSVGLKLENLGEKHYRQNAGSDDAYNAEDGMEAMVSVTYTPSW